MPSRLLSGLVALLLTGPLLVLPPRPAVAGIPAGGMTAAAVNAMFTQYADTGGKWSGGDSTASVKLPDGRLVWLFSDTFLGTVNPDHSRPRSSPFIRNSGMVQDGTALVKTLHGGTSSVPDTLIKPTAEGEFLWVADGTIESGALKVLLNRYRGTGAGVLDVELTGTELATFDPAGPTLTSLTPLPHGNRIGWGSAILEDGGYTYVYGTEHAQPIKFGHVARVPSGGLGGVWQFWTGSGWSASQDASVRLLSGVGTAFGVQKVGSTYVLVTQESNLVFNPAVVAYTSASPTGPWAGPLHLFTTPEPQNGRGIITYDTRFHPELATSAKLLVSYNVNSLVPDEVYADARIYRPRFADVAWPLAVPDPARVPPAPTGLTAVPDPAEGSIDLAWQPVAGATRYWVYQRDVTAGQTHFARHANAVEQPSYVAGLLRAGHTYEFRVAAANAVGEGQPSAVARVVARIDPPPAPTGVSATAAANGRITVSWSPVPRAWHYELFQRDVTAGETEFVSVTRPGGDTTSHAIDNLEKDHEFEFRVTAYNGAGASPASAPVRATARYDRPAAPTGLTATANPNGTITLRWGSAGDNVWYLIYQRDVTAGESEFTQLPLPITTCCEMTAAFLGHGHQYQYAVAATSRGGVSERSNVATAVAHFPDPVAPAGLRAVAGNGRVQLTWEGNPDYWYWVYQRDVTAGETEFTRLPFPVTNPSLDAQYLINGHEYEFKVAGLNQAGEGPASMIVRATPQVPRPGKVTGLTAAAQANGKIRLGWVAAGDDVWYLIWQRDRTANGGWVQIPLPLTTCCTFDAGLLSHGHEYEFRVAATNPGGVGEQSDIAGATSRYERPAAPGGLRGRAAGDGSVELDWDGPEDIYYWVHVREAVAGAPWVRSGIPTDKTHASWGSLRHGQAYEFKVTGENQGGEGPASAVITVTSWGGLPAAPSGLTATAGDGRVSLRWNASPTPNVFYVVYQRNASAGESWRPLPGVAGCCQLEAQYLHNGQRYEFKVAATNASGESATSNAVAATPLPPLPAAPSGLTASAGDGVVTLRWNASPTPGVWYWMEYRARGGGWQRAPYPVTTCCTFTMRYLYNGTTYDFRIRATNIAGDSAPSNVASATPLPPLPAAPSGLTASAGNGEVLLRWNPSPTPGVWYWIEYRANGGAWQRLPYPLTTCCEMRMMWLVNGWHYEFRVSATNMAGIGAWSNVAGARPLPPVPVTPGPLRAISSRWTIHLSWPPDYTPGVFYRIYYRNLSRGQGWWRTIDVATNMVPLFEFDHYGDFYEFEISSYNMAGESGRSNRQRAWIRPHQTSGVKRLANDLNGANIRAWTLASAIDLDCQHSPFYQLVCFGWSPGFDQPMTVGDVLFYPHSEDRFFAKLECESRERLEMLERGYTHSRIEWEGPHLLWHELVHSYQWARYGNWFDFAVEYAWDHMRFEREANLHWGSYASLPGVDFCDY